MYGLREDGDKPKILSWIFILSYLILTKDFS